MSSDAAARCNCGEGWALSDGLCWRCGNQRRNAEARAKLEAEKPAADLGIEQRRQWFRDTGHCGVCGQPGVFCLCRKPCACADLHECGSGIAADPLDVFAATPISDGQQELFG